MSESQGIMQEWKEQPATAKLSQRAYTFVTEVNQKLELGRQQGATAMEQVRLTLNTARECGLVLSTAKANLSSVQWKLAQAQLKLDDPRQIQGLLDFARKFPEPITDIVEAAKALEPAQMALGLVMFPHGHGHQIEREHNFALIFTKSATTMRAEIRKHLDRSPIKSWSGSYAQQFVSVAEPVVNDIVDILTQAKQQVEAAE